MEIYYDFTIEIHLIDFGIDAPKIRKKKEKKTLSRINIRLIDKIRLLYFTDVCKNFFFSLSYIQSVDNKKNDA